MENRFARVALIVAVAAFMLLGLSVVTAHSAAAQFGCFGATEDFESQFPPAGWQAIDDLGSSPVIWHRSDESPTYGVGNYPPMSGYYAYAESYPAYCGSSYDTWLVTPSFSTMGMREVLAEFDYQYWYYSGDTLDFDYSTDGGATWTTEQTMPSNGGYAATHVSIDLSAIRGEPNVMLRWRYYNTGGCDWWTGIDNVVMECAVDAAAVDALPVTFADPERACTTGLAKIEIDVTNTGTAPLNDLTGQPEFTVSVRATNGAPVSVTGINSGVGPGQIPGAAPLGGTATADLQIGVGETDTVVLAVGFPSGLGNTGDLIIDRGVWVDVAPQNGEIDLGELYQFFGDEEPFPIPCAPTVNPNIQLGMQVHLPIMNYIGNDDRCNTWIEVQNVSSNPVKAVLVTWGEPGFCPPQAAGPLKVECSGLLKPGSTWNLTDNQIPTGSKSGMLFKFSTRQLSDDGLDLIFGFDDIYADLMCETLFFGVVGDSDDWRRFKKAYNEGGTFAGIPLDLAAGFAEGGILAVEVLRDCPADVTAGARVTSKYNGISGITLGVYDPVFGGYSYYIPLIYADKAEFTSWVYVQNGGLECTSLEVWLQAQDDCMRARICEVLTLAPGETIQIDPNDCVGPQWQGSAWVRSSQPLGAVVDIVGRDVLMTYQSDALEINYTFNPKNPDALSGGNQVAFGPLVYSEYQGWDSGVQVQNLSPVLAAKVKVYFLDRSGDIITTLVDWICPKGSQTFFLPVIHDLPGNWAGSIRVESQEWITPNGPLIQPPNIVGVATMIKYSDAQRTETREAIAYNLLPEHKIFDWQIGYGKGALDNGIGLIAIPSLIKDLDGVGLTSELAITNVVPKPGFTDFVIFIYDQNGLIDYVCEKLNEKQVEYIDLQTWGFIGNGFKGSAIISAVFWEHDVFADDGRFLRNLVGLGAVSIERSKTRLGEDIAGDESAGSRGIPFRQSDVEDDEFYFGFMPAGRIPTCPGVPTENPADDGECPPTMTVSCTNCPVPLPDTVGGVGEIANVNVPAGCSVTDVNMLVDITHTYDGDLVVDLSSPELPNVPMWDGICGGNDNIQAILDDESENGPIGTVCPPSGFVDYTTAPPGGMTQFEGTDVNGTWLLNIQDQFGGDSGTLNTWSLTFSIQ